MGKRPVIGSGGERARQRAIREVDLEDARPVFERIARTARRLTGAPQAHVSIVQPRQIWLANGSREPLPPVPREQSFVKYVIVSDEMVWIEDLTRDGRFEGNPFVYGEFALRAYIGAPVILSDGSCVGALSVVDRVPRVYDAGLADALRDLAALAAQEWERGRALKALAAGEAKVRASNQVLAGVIENAPVALLMTDRQMRVVQASKRWRRTMSAADAPLVGRSVYDVFPGARARWGDVFGEALKGRVMRAARVRLEMPPDVQLWARAEVTPWRTLHGRIGGLLIMLHDISDMVDALEQARRSEQTLKLALEIGELSMWEMDHLGRRLSSAGPNIMAAYDDRRDYDDLERDIWYGVHPHDLPAARAAWGRYVKEGAAFRTTFRMMQPDGPHVWVQSAVEHIRNESGHVERTVGVLRNIDRQKRSELAIAKARDAAESANRAKSEFLANMSHEIRTPLNGVMGVASALARTPLGAGQREMVSLIESSARTLEALLSDVLDLARVESGRIELADEPFDLRSCLVDVGALFQPSAEAKSLDLVIEETPDIEGVFLGDAPRVRQILSNLVANAVKFTPSGEIRIGASGLCTPQGVEARIWVKDTGIGFDDEVKTRLFGRFEQADGSITRRYGGTGLGLAISRSLAERMGGDLDAVATLGQGATFTLSLPLTRAASPLPGDEPLEPVARAVRPARRLQVLLAEDHPINRRVVQLILESAGVELTCVENGAEAVEACETTGFDLVLMDMQMPVMDGLTAIRRIREREAASGRAPARIQALTANAMPEHAAASRAAGADGHLTKPISAEALFRAVGDAGGGVAAVSEVA